MKDMAISQVREFQSQFLEHLRAAHQQDVLDVLSSGVINDDVTKIIAQVARNICLNLKR